MQVGTSSGRIKRKGRAESEAVRAHADRRMIGVPITVTGISVGKLLTVTPSMYGRLDVDPSYQRGRMTEITKLIAVLQAGGLILDPVTICRRPWSSEPAKLWIVDGWQRANAFMELKRDFQAIVHESDSMEAEQAFFIALNARHAVSANKIVHAWPGPSGELLRAADESSGHPLFGRIHFQQGGNKARIDASVLVRGCVMATTGARNSDQIQGFLRRLDAELKKAQSRARAEHYLRLVGMIFDKGRAPSMPCVVLGELCAERWGHDVEMPKQAVIDRLKKVKWEAEVPAFNEKFRPILVNLVGRIWKEG